MAIGEMYSGSAMKMARGEALQLVRNYEALGFGVENKEGDVELDRCEEGVR